jgi:predicted RNase H-like HicB family nuclease
MGEIMVMHYVAVLVPERGGGWSVLFPDLPGCATGGETVQEAIAMAASAAAGWLAAARDHGDEIPPPRSHEQIRADEAWGRERGIDWSTAVISLINVKV